MEIGKRGRVLRKARSYTMLPPAHNLLQELADKHHSNPSRIMETIILKYGPKLLKARENQVGNTL